MKTIETHKCACGKIIKRSSIRCGMCAKRYIRIRNVTRKSDPRYWIAENI